MATTNTNLETCLDYNHHHQWTESETNHERKKKQQLQQTSTIVQLAQKKKEKKWEQIISKNYAHKWALAIVFELEFGTGQCRFIQGLFQVALPRPQLFALCDWAQERVKISARSVSTALWSGRTLGFPGSTVHSCYPTTTSTWITWPCINHTATVLSNKYSGSDCQNKSYSFFIRKYTNKILVYVDVCK